jgi:putative DNA-invertase from lambdoid prophage Rac
MKIAIYCRVSTDKQTHDSQLTELRDYCQRRAWLDVTEYCDTVSGSKFTRKALDCLLSDIRRGRVDCVVCYKLDRLGRSLAHLAQLLAEFNAHRVALICTSQGIDTSNDNPAGRLQLGVLMAVAEFEREIIRERVNAGLRAAKANGVKLGRPESLSGHRQAVEALRAKGYGTRAIARELSMPISSVSKLVRQIPQKH